jgi:hypothetical protein
MMRALAHMLTMKYAVPMILTGTFALAAGGAAALNTEGDHDGHHNCQFSITQTTPSSASIVDCWTWYDRDGDGR